MHPDIQTKIQTQIEKGQGLTGSDAQIRWSAFKEAQDQAASTYLNAQYNT